MPRRSDSNRSRSLSLTVLGAVATILLLAALPRPEREFDPADFTPGLSAPLQSSIFSGPMTSLYGSTRQVLAPISSAMQSALAPAARWVRHKISKGDTLSRIWEHYGASRESAERAALALKDAGSSAAKLRHGEEIEIQLSPEGTIEGFKKWERDGTLIVLEEDLEHGYSSHRIEPEISESVRTASGVISSSFASAAHQTEVPYSVIDEYVDLFGGRVEFQRALQPGDTFTIQYTERRTDAGELLEPGPIVAASIKTGGKMMVALRHADSDGKARFYDEDGNALGNFFLRYPLQFTRISSSFSESRFHPVLKIRRPHNGVDFAAPQGTPVRSVADGVVELAGWSSGGGNTVKIRHGDRWSTAYLHLARFASGIKRGSRVSRGEVIGTVGMTGLATAPHLHFSLYDRKEYVNPLTTALPQMPNGGRLPKDFLLATLQDLRTQHELLDRAQIAQRGASEPRRKV